MKQWKISKLEQKEMEDVNYKKLLFLFYNAQSDRIEKWFEKIGLNHTSRFEDCRKKWSEVVRRIRNKLLYTSQQN